MSVSLKPPLAQKERYLCLMVACSRPYSLCISGTYFTKQKALRHCQKRQSVRLVSLTTKSRARGMTAGERSRQPQETWRGTLSKLRKGEHGIFHIFESTLAQLRGRVVSRWPSMA